MTHSTEKKLNKKDWKKSILWMKMDLIKITQSNEASDKSKKKHS